jgi:L-rhamnose isomerase
MKQAELDGDFTHRLVMLEEQKSMPWTAVWDYYCAKKGVPLGGAWFDEVKAYEKQVLSKR